MNNYNKFSFAILIALATGCGSQVVKFAEDSSVNMEDVSVDSGFADVSVDSACRRDSNEVDADTLEEGLDADTLDDGLDADTFEEGLDADTSEADVFDSSVAEADAVAEAEVIVGCLPKLGATVPLGTAGDFVILAKSGISTVPNSIITGDIGVSPISATAITGFALIADSSNTFSTSTQVTGKVYAADYTPPTPSKMTTAVGDMETAFTDAASRAPDFTELGAGDVSGMTLAPGVYKWGTGLLISTNITLKGACSDVWIFEIAKDLTISNGVNVFLSGGALAKNVFWQVSGSVKLGTTSHTEGVILTQTAVSMSTSSSINGRLLAQTAVTLDQSTVVQP